jgi:hypothetical protein
MGYVKRLLTLNHMLKFESAAQTTGPLKPKKSRYRFCNVIAFADF